MGIPVGTKKKKPNMGQQVEQILFGDSNSKPNEKSSQSIHQTNHN